MSEQETLLPPKSNVPEFSVSDLAGSLKRTLEDNYGRVRVRGELSRITVAASGHMYTDLKDDKAVINSICWKGTLSKLSIKPEEGMEVICTGRISTYPQRSNYQLIIESMELAGEGALLKLLEERKKKLTAEGLFAEDKKRPIPFLPDTIGVITSPTGAVIRDILHRLSDRFPRHVLLWPAVVQGENAAEQISAAINGFQTIDRHGLPKPDVLIVARGGGSLEDLMPFNEESVARAVANSTIPVISAVGHETDTTLCDFAADLRAPTPTGAAEKAVPVRANLAAQILESEQRLVSGTNRLLNECKNTIATHSARLGDPTRLLESQTQRIDHLSDKLRSIFTRYIDAKKHPLIETGAKLRRPEERLKEAQTALNRWHEQLSDFAPKLTENSAQTLQHFEKMLEAYSYKNTLKRGFSVVRDANGKIVSLPQNIKNGEALDIEFVNDQRLFAITTSQNAKPKIKKAKPKAPPSNTQKSLFD